MSKHPGLFMGGPAPSFDKALATTFERYTRVMWSGTDLTAAGAYDIEYGTTGLQMPGSGQGSSTAAAVVIPCAEGIPLFIANGAIPINSDVYRAASGLVSATPAGLYLGKAIRATTGTGQFIPVLRLPSRSRLMFSNSAVSAAVTNTTTETDFGVNFSLPANTLIPGDVLRITAQVDVTGVTGGATLTIKLYLGSQLLIATAAVADSANDIGYITADCLVLTNGASGTFLATGVESLGAPGTATAKPWFLGSSAINTTIANTIQASATWSAASASDTAVLNMLTVERKAA